MLGIGRKAMIATVVALGAIGLGGGYALAAHRTAAVTTVAPDGTITACVGKMSGRIRIVGQASSCRGFESVLTWNTAAAGGGGGAATPDVSEITFTLPNGDTVNGGDPPAPTFEIKDWSFGVENPTTIGSATGGAGAGKVKFNEFTIKKTVDAASPALFKACASGVHYKTVTLTVRKAGATSPYLTYTFGTVFISAVNFASPVPGDPQPMDAITMVYGTLTVTEAPTSGSPVTAGWDQITNRLL